MPTRNIMTGRENFINQLLNQVLANPPTTANDVDNRLAVATRRNDFEEIPTPQPSTAEYHTSGETGASAIQRARQYAWQQAADKAKATNDALGAHIEQILGSEKWTGDAAEAYKSWAGELQTKFLTPVRQGMEKTHDELLNIAKTVENMRRALITSAIQFTVAYFALQKMGPLGTAMGAIFSTAGIELLNDHTSGLLGIWDDYFRALEPHAATLRKIPDLPDAKVGMHIRYPNGTGRQVVTPPINREKIGDWGNWGNVKVD